MMGSQKYFYWRFAFTFNSSFYQSFPPSPLSCHFKYPNRIDPLNIYESLIATIEIHLELYRFPFVCFAFDRLACEDGYLQIYPEGLIKETKFS